MKTLIAIIVASGALALQSQLAQARIGETGAQIEARYGKWVPPIAGGVGIHAMKMYRKAGMFIGVTYIDGKSAREIYRKDDKSEFTEHEIALLMAANAAGHDWKLVDEGPVTLGAKHWIREGDNAVCGYEDNSLMIASAQWFDLLKATNKSDEEKKLSGF